MLGEIDARAATQTSIPPCRIAGAPARFSLSGHAFAVRQNNQWTVDAPCLCARQAAGYTIRRLYGQTGQERGPGADAARRARSSSAYATASSGRSYRYVS